VIRRSGGVSVMLEDAQIGLVGMMVQAIEHVRRFTHRHRNDPRVGRPVMTGHVRIEHRAGVDAVFGIDGTARARTASDPEILPVRRQACPAVPDRRHRMPVVRVDDGGAGDDVVVVADVPLRHVDEVMVAEPPRRVGHAGDRSSGGTKASAAF
jgi:hypothetical protein